MLTLPNGHWVLLAETSKDFTDLPGYPGTTSVLGDALIDVDPTGNVAWAWSGFDHLDVNRHLQGLPDWTHSNAVVYTSDGNLLLSMRHQSWVVKIDYQDGAGAGDILWRLGQDGDFSIPGGDSSQWFYGQHYPSLITNEGTQLTLAIWDNGNFRIDSSGTACGATVACYSRASIFKIDENAKSADLLWQNLPGFYSYWGGSIDVLTNGNVEYDMSAPFGYTLASRVLEVTQTANPQVVWQLDVSGENAYRAYRIPSLYPGVAWQQ
ncbi:MAG: arylsulfate sulfotransferase [Acidobacteriaceae bacterium]|nr:arylsulfate sulfotransferase [Acidobacteriaceae bacterium]